MSEISPFKAIVIIEEDVSEFWQWDVSRWLVSSGCRYMLAWGTECTSWDESVDEAGLEAFDYEDIPEDQRVMTTSHDDEELSEAFWFAKHRAHHPAQELRDTIILHIAEQARQQELIEMYEDS
ncbi:hypothetical protein D3871_25690 [Noviherbaspirillum saxi]|uniref:DUF7684 domain-containing protein n=2 Tax=Noviherbaspirillum saxi TaxID=2320863 RepID=A0A3A3FH92_9BURK|nr:hypothetical protein D3871_25690 [Noviherbaspirillum saxi]